ncbi:acyl carrier protein [Nocardia mexicana]|uniref:Acyl carrier protein n=1 Tax=Nocardia mexicana TaxID=279262 RepID=A0A370GPS5_9NOCA|nr:acyl carrier protein [Nocardia mexicana]RDI45256.1 acyl carrier protein [Nocardia mexicana]
MTVNPAQEMSSLHIAIREIVAAELEIDPGDLDPTADFENEYEADSLTLLAVVTRFERELSIVIPSDETVEMTNLERVFELVAQHGHTAATSPGGTASDV